MNLVRDVSGKPNKPRREVGASESRHRSKRRQKPPKPHSASEALTWADAWIFASLERATARSGRILLPQLLHAADLLNRAVPTTGEIQQAFRALYRRGLIRVRNGAIFVSSAASSLYQRARAKRGGLFSLVDNTFLVLNSSRHRFAIRQSVPDLRFITEA